MRTLVRFVVWLCGGRPMTRKKFMFVDVVSGGLVYQYEDLYGRKWLAESAWSAFRVNIDNL